MGFLKEESFEDSLRLIVSDAGLRWPANRRGRFQDADRIGVRLGEHGGKPEITEDCRDLLQARLGELCAQLGVLGD